MTEPAMDEKLSKLARALLESGVYRGESPRKPEDAESAVEAIKKIPALYVDTFHVWTWPGHVRITFGESMEPESQFRSAVVLPIEDAQSLSEMLARMIAQQKKDDAEAKK